MKGTQRLPPTEALGVNGFDKKRQLRLGCGWMHVAEELFVMNHWGANVYQPRGSLGGLAVARFSRLVGGFLGALLATSFGQQIPTDKAVTFDAASVKASSTEKQLGGGRKGEPPFTTGPTRLAARHLTLKGLISRAYGIDESQVSRGPTWIDADRYDIDAKVENPTSREAMLGMLRALLADRFRLRMHRETKTVPRYVLVVAKNGPKFGPHFHAAETAPPAAGNRPTNCFS